ncbi:Mucin-1 [Ilyonectria robusta]
MDMQPLKTWLKQAAFYDASPASPEVAEVAEVADAIEVTEATKVAVPKTDPVTALENYIIAGAMKKAEEAEEKKKRAENNVPAPPTVCLKRKRAANEDPSETAPIASTQPDLAPSPSVRVPMASMEPGLPLSTLIPDPIASTQPGLSQFSSVPAPNQLIMPSMEAPSLTFESAPVPALPMRPFPAPAQTQQPNITADVSNAWGTGGLPTIPAVDLTMLNSIANPIGNGYDTRNGYCTAYGYGIVNGFANANGNFIGNDSSSNGLGFTNGCVTGNGSVLISTANPPMLSNNINPVGNGYGTTNGHGTINNFNVGPNPAPSQQATQQGAVHNHHRHPQTQQQPGPNITGPNNGEPGQAKCPRGKCAAHRQKHPHIQQQPGPNTTGQPGQAEGPRLNHGTNAIPRNSCMETAEHTAKICNLVQRMAQEIAELKEKVQRQDMMIETMQNISTAATSPATDCS